MNSSTKCEMMDGPDSKDPGEVFAIQDLYGPSKFLSDALQNPSFLFSELKLDGFPTLPQREIP
jgi:hypothetical protein